MILLLQCIQCADSLFTLLFLPVNSVGYGDLAPTSSPGRAIANIVMLTGLVTLALPIGVIGTNFTDMYKEAVNKKWLDAADALQLKVSLSRTKHNNIKQRCVLMFLRLPTLLATALHF